MNGNDLMNALSGLDPKYIDEAAFELHGTPASRNKAKIARFRRGLTIALPIAAAALLTILVAMPAILRVSKSGQSTSPGPASDSAMNMQSETAAEAPASYDMGDAAAEAEVAYEAEEPLDEDVISGYPAEDYAPYNDAAEQAETGGVTAPSDTYNDAVTESKTEAAKTAIDISQATYRDGLLILETIGTQPTDPGDLAYAIKGSDAAGTEILLAEGPLQDVLTSTDPITLDLTALKLPAGDYTLTVAGESIGFTVTE